MSTAREVLRWKERRTLLPIWISLGALFLIVFFFVASIGNVAESTHAINYLVMLWVGGCLIGLATGIMLFVPEREQETDLLLGQFPVASKTVVRAKLTEAMLVFFFFVLVTGVVVVSTYWFRHGQFLWNETEWINFSVLAFVPVQTFLWSCCFSLCFRNSLTALVCCPVCGSQLVRHAVRSKHHARCFCS